LVELCGGDGIFVVWTSLKLEILDWFPPLLVNNLTGREKEQKRKSKPDTSPQKPVVLQKLVGIGKDTTESYEKATY